MQTRKLATAYYANIDLAVNALTLFVQLFVTRALLSRFGIAPALLIPGRARSSSVMPRSAASPLPLLVAIGAGGDPRQRVLAGQARTRNHLHAGSAGSGATRPARPSTRWYTAVAT